MTRHPYAIGHRKDGKTQVAVQCCICERWMSVEDAWRAFTGAKTSHGMHQECAREFYGDDLPPDAA